MRIPITTLTLALLVGACASSATSSSSPRQTPAEAVQASPSRLTIGDVVYFAAGSAEVPEAAHGTLEGLADAISKHTGTVSVEGHADPATEGDPLLAQRRAESVRNFLIDAGAPAKRVRTVNHGMTRPRGVAADKNRRVEFGVD